MDDKDRTPVVNAEVQQLKRENTRLKTQLDEHKQRRRKEHKRATAQWEQVQDAFLTMQCELQDKLQKLTDEKESVEDKLAESVKARAVSEEQMKLWRNSANKYKKKVREQRMSGCGHGLSLTPPSTTFSRQRGRQGEKSTLTVTP